MSPFSDRMFQVIPFISQFEILFGKKLGTPTTMKGWSRGSANH